MEPSLIYFGHSDLQEEPFIAANELRRELLQNLLFQGNLGITDGFWFMSEHVIRELRKPQKENWIWEGTRLGLIRPWLRKGTFVEAEAEIRDKGIRGLVPNSAKIAKRLDDYTEREDWKPTFRAHPWPAKHVGKSFESIVNGFFAGPPPTPRVNGIWKRIREAGWTTDCVREATSGDSGLRRGNLFEAVGERVDPKNRKEIRNARVLLDLATGQTRDDLRHYIRWINQAYQFNQASIFQMEANIPAGRRLENLMSVSFFPDPKVKIRKTEVLPHVVKVPNLARLLRLHPKKVLRMRLTEEADNYFKAYATWKKLGSDGSADVVQRALNEYAESLCIEFRKSCGEDWDIFVTAFGAPLPEKARIPIDLILKTAIVLGEQKSHELAFLILAFEVAWGLSVWTRPEQVKRFLKEMDALSPFRTRRLKVLLKRDLPTSASPTNLCLRGN